MASASVLLPNHFATSDRIPRDAFPDERFQHAAFAVINISFRESMEEGSSPRARFTAVSSKLVALPVTSVDSGPTS